MTRKPTKHADAADDGGLAQFDIIEVRRNTLEVYLVGTTPFIFNAVSSKGQRQILYPPPRKNQAERASVMKHDPIAEYRSSAYTISDPRADTLFFIPATAFKSAMMTAALDVPGVTKTQIARVVSVVGSPHSERIPVYGAPQLRMDVVKNAGMTGAPDIRTRMTLPRWCCRVPISFAVPMLTATAVINIHAAAGITVGVGDFRQEKGKGSHGLWQLVGENDALWLDIAGEGRAVQQAGYDSPDFYNTESEELFKWFNEEVARRGRAEQMTVAKPAKSRAKPAVVIPGATPANPNGDARA